MTGVEGKASSSPLWLQKILLILATQNLNICSLLGNPKSEAESSPTKPQGGGEQSSTSFRHLLAYRVGMWLRCDHQDLPPGLGS